MSFSGIKTSVVTTVRRHPDAGNEDVAASFQQAVVDVLVEKAMRAAEQIGAQGICLAGGVAANGPLQRRPGRALQRGRHRRLPAEPGDVHRQRRHGRRRGMVAARRTWVRRRSTPRPTHHCGWSSRADPELTG